MLCSLELRCAGRTAALLLRYAPLARPEAAAALQGALAAAAQVSAPWLSGRCGGQTHADMC